MNRKKSAIAINEGANKYPCSWILFNGYEVRNKTVKPDLDKRLWYNPRILPHWFNSIKKDIDGSEYQSLITNGSGVYKYF
jgi:hypothetical protein